MIAGFTCCCTSIAAELIKHTKYNICSVFVLISQIDRFFIKVSPCKHGIQYNTKQDAREAMRVVFSVLTKRICMHKTKFLMNIFKYCLKIILNSMNLQIATQLIIMFNF